MAIKNTVRIFDPSLSIVKSIFQCRLSGEVKVQAATVDPIPQQE